MMSPWSHRPQFLHLGLFFVAYVLGCGFAQLLAIVPGTGISIWPPSGLFIATLILASRPSWPWWVLAGCLAELFSNFLWFHNQFPAALLIYSGNALEATVGAYLVGRSLRPPVRLQALPEVLAFVVLCAGIAPVISATVGSATLAWFQIQTFSAAWPLWWIGDATGVLIVAPLALVALQNWRGEAQLSRARWLEACIVGLIFLAVAALSLSGYLPFAYVIMPPLLWAAVRFEFKGAAVTLVLLALVAAAFTISGASEFAGDLESQKHKQIMLQLFLAISAFSALIVAAISHQYQLAVHTLRLSERRLQQLIDAVPALIWGTTREGTPNFVNKRFTDVTGATLADIIAPDGSPSLSVFHPEDRAAAAPGILHSLKSGVSFSVRYRQLRRDGSYRWTQTRAEPLRDESGTITQWYGISVDVDDEVRAQQALRERDRELSQLVDMVPGHLWRLTPDGMPIFFNKRMVDFIGLDVTDMDQPGMSRLDATLKTVVHPDDVTKVVEALNLSLISGAPFSMRYRLRRSDGVYRWMSSRAEPMRDEDGRIVQWYGMCHDIDDQVHAEEALRDRERELSLLVDMVPSNLWRLTPDGETTLANKRMADFLGLDLSDKRQMETVFDTIFHPDDAQPVADALTRSLNTGDSFAMRYRLRRWDGVYRWMSGRAEPLRDQDGNIAQWFGLCHDVDDEVHAQEALRKREQELSLLVDMVPSNLWRLSPDSEMTLVNKRMAEFLGLTVGDKHQPPLMADTLIHPDDLEAARDSLTRSLLTGDSLSMSCRLRRCDGVYRWMSARAEPLRDEDGRIAQWFGLFHDIDDQMQAEEALRQSERRLQQMIDAVPVRIWSMTPNGGPIYFNKRYQDDLRAAIANFEALDEPHIETFVNELIHQEDAAYVLRTLHNCFDIGSGSVMRFRWREKGGTYRWAECRVEPRRDQDGTVTQWYGVSIDIDDEVRAQNALRRASAKLAQATQAASLAELSASIAHEVNQPLAAIVANSYACHRWLSAEPPNLERAKITAERITRDAKAAADVVNRIRALFRHAAHTRSTEDINRLINEACRLVADETSTRNVRIDPDLTPDLPPVTADRVQLQQVIINLIRNGIEAMDGIANGARVLQIRSCRNGHDSIRIEVRDTGAGFTDPERIFEPFFTTKENGMGMGLAICRSIVESHGGHLSAEKNEPQGAAFIFTLPVGDKPEP